MKKIQISLAMIMFLFAIIVQASPPILVDPQAGKYLGTLSKNRFDLDSVSNPYGQYGSRYSPDSLNNPYATSSPVIISPADSCD